MIWLWRIYSDGAEALARAAPKLGSAIGSPSAGKLRTGVALLSLCGALPAAAATLTGSVTLTPAEEKAARKIRDHSGVVVWLESKNPETPRPGPVIRRAVMEQRNKTFIPHVLAIEVGTTVDFPNFDPIFHNAFSNYDGQVFDVHLYAPNTTKKVLFRRPGMVRVFCNIHAQMSAVIAVLPTPYFAVTGADGKFAIEAPSGAYRFQLWHERSQDEVLARHERQIALPEKGLVLPEIRLAEQAFLAVPHKNKYGRDYPPPRDEHVYYPGVRR